MGMTARIPTPHVYINVHQTIAVGLAAGAVLAYIFDFKGFRTSVNFAIINAGRGLPDGR